MIHKLTNLSVVFEQDESNVMIWWTVFETEFEYGNTTPKILIFSRIHPKIPNYLASKNYEGVIGSDVCENKQKCFEKDIPSFGNVTSKKVILFLKRQIGSEG